MGTMDRNRRKLASLFCARDWRGNAVPVQTSGRSRTWGHDSKGHSAVRPMVVWLQMVSTMGGRALGVLVDRRLRVADLAPQRAWQAAALFIRDARMRKLVKRVRAIQNETTEGNGDMVAVLTKPQINELR